MVLPRGHSGPFGSGPEAGDGVDLEEAEVVPAAVLEFLLAGLGQEQSLAVGAEAGVSDAVLGVDAEEITTAGRFEKRKVPSALEQPAGHDEVLPIRVEVYDDDYFSQRIASRFWLPEAKGKNNCR